MYFTREDLLKIQKFISQNAIKDTSFEVSNVIYESDLLPIIQNTQNRVISIKNFINKVQANYYTKQDIDKKLAELITGDGELSLDSYVTEEELQDTLKQYATIQSLKEYVTINTLQQYCTKKELEEALSLLKQDIIKAFPKNTVATKEQLYSITDAYLGMLVTCLEDKNAYILIDINNITNELGWSVISSKAEDNPEQGDIDLSDYITTEQLINTLNTYFDNYDLVVDEKIKKAIDSIIIPEYEQIILEDEVTEDSSNAVKSSGIFKAIINMVDAKFQVLTQKDYDDMESHDGKTFYFIKKI